MCFHNASLSEIKNGFRFHSCFKIRELFYKVVDKDAVYGQNKKGEMGPPFDDAAAKKYFSTLLKRPREIHAKLSPGNHQPQSADDPNESEMSQALDDQNSTGTENVQHQFAAEEGDEQNQQQTAVSQDNAKRSVVKSETLGQSTNGTEQFIEDGEPDCKKPHLEP